jgi:hypothetical protein
VNSGVVALRIAASPLGMWVWPQEDQRERNGVVQQPHHEVGAPGGGTVRQRGAGRARQHDQDCGRERHAAERDRQRRQHHHDQLGEEERAAPQDRERDQQKPVGCRHREADACHGSSNFVLCMGLFCDFFPAGSHLIPKQARAACATRFAVTSR